MDPQVFHRGDSLAIESGSDNTWTVKVRTAHPTEHRTRRRGLTRRELTAGIIARFQAKVQRTESCWLWLSTRTRHNYGLFFFKKEAGRVIQHYAHRIAYVLAHGDINGDLVVMHTCDNPQCVNPAHLRLGTQRDNMRDSAAKGRTGKVKPGLRKITIEGVREIRESSEPSRLFAERWGVHVSHINKIRRGEKRKAA
jgi:hypothetical protein